MKFIEGNDLNTELSNLTKSAEEYLWLISPYVKLNERFIFYLNDLKQYPHAEIVVVFGKNESDLSKSLSAEDLAIFKEFPNVKVLHVKNLHAKYYGNEHRAIITSMNLYEFSQVNNLEAGVVLQPKNGLKKVADLAMQNDGNSPFEDAYEFFLQVIQQSTLIFHRRPNFKKTLLGLKEKYEGSETVIDEIDKYYKSKYFKAVQPRTVATLNGQNGPFQNISTQPFVKDAGGYCIRTGNPIDYDPSRPFSYDAYLIWAKFSNVDYPENYCHRTGKKSYGKTSMRKPSL